jgi:hypothetical protein
MARRLLPVVLAMALAGLAGCSGSGGTPKKNHPPQPAPSDATLCRLLTAADFNSAAGLTVSAPTANNSTDVEAYCVYGSNAEMDVFVSKSADDAGDVIATVLSEGPVTTKAENVVTGADQSIYGTIESVQKAGVTVRRGALVFAISIPAATPDAQTKLVALAKLALGRATGIG